MYYQKRLLLLVNSLVWLCLGLLYFLNYFPQLPKQQIHLIFGSTYLLMSFFSIFKSSKIICLKAQILILILTSIFTVYIDPQTIISPFGLVTKNIVWIMFIYASWLHFNEKSSSSVTLSKYTLAFIWLYEGLVPKILFQQEIEIDFLHYLNLTNHIDPSVLLSLIGVGEILLAILIMLSRGDVEKLIIKIQFLLLIVITVLASFNFLDLWLHPLGPFVKNFPIIGISIILLIKGNTSND